MGNSASALPFSIDNQIGAPQDHNGWALHVGKSASDGSAVSVFVGKKPLLAKTPVSQRTPSLTQLKPANHHYQNCRKLRHPQILKVHATLDTDNPNEATTAGATAEASAVSSATTGDLIIVTEPCIALEQWFRSKPGPEQLAWGLECVIRSLHFLHSSANLAHGNLSPSSFYVTPAGDVKLWNFSLITPIGPDAATGGPTKHFQEWEGPCTPDAYRSPERIERRFDALANAGVHCMDSYSLGILIDHWFPGAIPQPIQKAVQRLQTMNLKMRPRLQPLLKCPIFDTPYQKVNLLLDEIAVQPIEQKIMAWQNVGNMVQAGLLPQATAVYKLWPLLKSNIVMICTNEAMLSQDLYRREVLSMLQPFFFIAENLLEGDVISKEMAPLIGLLFVVKDRGVRAVLLSKVSLMTQHLDKNTLNASVFEPLCSGFSDSSSALRELTLKATLVLVPSLNQPNLEKLSRYLVRMQSDSETSIRTNTVIFISKLAPHLSESSQQKLLLPAFIRAMKDPFSPCRMAALQSTLKSVDNFKMQELGTKVLPTVTPLLLDPMEDVRKEAFSVVDTLLVTLRAESDRMAHIARREATQQAQAQSSQTSHMAPNSAPAPSIVAPAPASGSYLKGLSSWVAGSTKASDGPVVAAAPASGPSPQMSRPAPVPVPVRAAPAPPVQQFSSMGMSNNVLATETPADEDWGDEDDIDADSDGWGDDMDEGLGNLSASSGFNAGGNSSISNKPFAAPAPSNPFSADMDDPFASIGAMPAKKIVPRVGGSGGKLMMPKKAMPIKKIIAAPATKLSIKDDEVADGWDDF